MNDYTIYAIFDPTKQQVRYVGLSKDPEKRFKQHLHRSVWVRELLQTGIQPLLKILERTDTLQQAREAEKHWIGYYEGQGHALENLVSNEPAIREREESAALYQKLYAQFSQNLSHELTEKLIKMTLAGYGVVGFCAWDDKYESVLGTIKLLEKNPDFGLDLNEIDAAKLTFNLFGYRWAERDEDEV